MCSEPVTLGGGIGDACQQERGGRGRARRRGASGVAHSGGGSTAIEGHGAAGRAHGGGGCGGWRGGHRGGGSGGHGSGWGGGLSSAWLGRHGRLGGSGGSDGCGGHGSGGSGHGGRSGSDRGGRSGGDGRGGVATGGSDGVGLLDDHLAVEGLQDVVVHATGLALGVVVRVVLAGHHDDGGLGERGLGADGASHLVAVHSAHGCVGEDEVGDRGFGLRDGIVTVRHGEHLRVFPRKGHLHDGAHRRAVVDRQDLQSHSCSPNAPYFEVKLRAPWYREMCAKVKKVEEANGDAPNGGVNGG
jgi:hypothetical protein